MTTNTYRPLAAYFIVAILILTGLNATDKAARADSTPTIAQQLQPFVDNDTIPGAVVLVASKDKIIDMEAVGYAERGLKMPMKTDSLFWIASMSKAMTSAGVMVLVDQGKVSLDDPVSKYIPEFATDKTWPIKPDGNDKHPQPPTATRDITVRMVLSHNAGIRFASPLETPTLDVHTLADRVVSYTKVPLLFDPGTGWSYSNAGINTGGRIIEVVSGMPYERFMDENVFKPLGMTDTTFFPNHQQLARLARAYRPGADGKLKPYYVNQCKYPLDDPDRHPMPAGGLFSTASDVAQFCQMLLGGGVGANGKRVLSKMAVTSMTTKETADGVPTSYGFGLGVGPGTFGHGGAYSTDMEVDANKGVITVFMVQMAGWYPKKRDAMYGALSKAWAPYKSGPSSHIVSGSYVLVPVSGPNCALEVQGGGKTSGTIVDLGALQNSPDRHWILTEVSTGKYLIQPEGAPTLALTDAGQATADGSPADVETMRKDATQLWSFYKAGDGIYNISLASVPTTGLDDYGGGSTPGAKVDIWSDANSDPHLQWKIVPVADMK